MKDSHEGTWEALSLAVYAHIMGTRNGHYVKAGTIEPLEFMESYLHMDWMVGQVIKYVCRVPVTRNPKDLYKAAHYLSRLALKIEQKPEKE